MAKKNDLETAKEWRRHLWEMAESAAKKHSGQAVVKALEDATGALHANGMDKRYDKLAKKASTDGLWCAFDITWLAAFLVELERLS